MRRLMTRGAPLIATSFTILFLFACGGEDVGDPSDPTTAKDPSGQTLLKDLPITDIEAAFAKTAIEINLARPEGIKLAVAAFVAELKTKGLDSTSIASMTDTTLCPTTTDSTGKTTGVKCKTLDQSGSTKPSSDGVGSVTQLLTKNEYSKYYTCPILAPEENGNTSCVALAEAVWTKVSAEVLKDKDAMVKLVAAKYKDMEQTAQTFIAMWAYTAKQYGVQLATIYAAHELKAAGQCDTKTNANEVAYNLGITQGITIVNDLRAWALSQVTSCTVNTDAIAQQVKTMALAKINAYMKEKAVCTDADISSMNDKFKAAELKREEGIKKGIDQQVTVLSNELWQARQNAPCGGGGGGGEPLVIDLDNDGLSLTTNRVRFDVLGDGTAQATTWAGSREGFLAIDRNKDGQISSVSELMGNQSNCNNQLCYDGVEALRALDQNGDGLVDRRDAAFAQLLIWVDSNSDGLSQPGELSSLSGHGIKAFSLKAQDLMVRSAAGTITRSVEVMTDRGSRTAYDVWFRVALGLENLPALTPGL